MDRATLVTIVCRHQRGRSGDGTGAQSHVTRQSEGSQKRDESFFGKNPVVVAVVVSIAIRAAP